MKYLIPYLHPAENNKIEKERKQIKQIGSKKISLSPSEEVRSSTKVTGLVLEGRTDSLSVVIGRGQSLWSSKKNWLGALIVGKLFLIVFSFVVK